MKEHFQTFSKIVFLHILLQKVFILKTDQGLPGSSKIKCSLKGQCSLQLEITKYFPC